MPHASQPYRQLSSNHARYQSGPFVLIVDLTSGRSALLLDRIAPHPDPPTLKPDPTLTLEGRKREPQVAEYDKVVRQPGRRGVFPIAAIYGRVHVLAAGPAATGAICGSCLPELVILRHPRQVGLVTRRVFEIGRQG